ncbi:MAG: ATP-binding protein, partial [Planctomycetia bacterium]
IQAPGFNFTAYLKSPLIPELVEENAFAFQEMDPVIISLRDTAKSVLRKHFDEREALKSSDLITQWCEEEVYPYQASDLDPLTTVTRKVFDVCAVKVHEHLKGFEKTEKKNKQLTFRLLKEALENNPESLERILKQILELPPEQQDELARILNRTHISAVINATKTVVGRLDFISSLDSLLFGDFKKDLLERKQLHRILARELWIFGEQYTLGNDDQALTSVLKKHVSILGRDDLAPEDMNNVTDVDGKSRIVDLMLYKQIPQCRPNHFEHLVIELKRPICRLGAEEFTQINKYAFAVADDERFDKSHTKWTFVLIGNDLDAYVDGLCRVKDREYGHVHSSDDGSVNVYVKKWSVILEEVKWRYEFFRKKLELEVSADDGLHYLREKHNDRLPERSSAKKGHSKAS